MTDPNATLPPNTPRTWLKRLVAWGEAHPDWLLAALLGFVAGAVLL